MIVHSVFFLRVCSKSHGSLERVLSRNGELPPVSRGGHGLVFLGSGWFPARMRRLS